MSVTQSKGVSWRAVRRTKSGDIIPIKGAFRVLISNEGETDLRIGNQGDNDFAILLEKKPDELPAYERIFDAGDPNNQFKEDMEIEFDEGEGSALAIIYHVGELEEKTKTELIPGG